MSESFYALPRQVPAVTPIRVYAPPETTPCRHCGNGGVWFWRVAAWPHGVYRCDFCGLERRLEESR